MSSPIKSLLLQQVRSCTLLELRLVSQEPPERSQDDTENPTNDARDDVLLPVPLQCSHLPFVLIVGALHAQTRSRMGVKFVRSVEFTNTLFTPCRAFHFHALLQSFHSTSSVMSREKMNGLVLCVSVPLPICISYWPCGTWNIAVWVQGVWHIE
jgi:hypothetical protein